MSTQIIVEAVVALALGILGAVMRVDELKEITWRSEMKKRCVYVLMSCMTVLTRHRPLEDIDPRLSFATFAKRAGFLPADGSKAVKS